MKKVFVVTLITIAFLSATTIFAFAGSKIVGFSQVDNQNPWRLAETESIKSEAKARGYKLKYSDGQAVQANQIAAVRDFIAQGVDESDAEALECETNLVGSVAEWIKRPQPGESELTRKQAQLESSCGLSNARLETIRDSFMEKEEEIRVIASMLAK